MEESSQKSIKNSQDLKKEDEGEEDFLVDLLEQYRRGKTYGSPGKNGLTNKAGRSTTPSQSSVAGTASPSSSLSSSFRKEEEEEDKEVGNDWSQGNTSAHRGFSSVSSRSEIGIDESWDAKSENFEDQTGLTEKTDNQLVVMGTGEIWDAKSENSKNRTGSTENTDNSLELILPSSPNTKQQKEENRGNVEIEEAKDPNPETSEKSNLQKLLAAQEIYELYCPNCNSCITRRIIFKERKQEQHEPTKQSKREEQDASEVSDLVEERGAFGWLRFLFGLDKETSMADVDSKKLVQQSEEDEHDISESKSKDIPPSHSVIEKEDMSDLPVAVDAGGKKEKDPTVDKSSSCEIDTGVVDLSDTTPLLQNKEYDIVSIENKSFFQRLVFLPPKLPIVVFGWWKKRSTSNAVETIENQKVEEDKVDDDDDDEDQVSVVSDTEIEPTKLQKDKKTKVLGLEILKSIVYGGLDESIKSLGIVSSAAGSGAKTLNILALGLANMVGGLSVFTHNLRDLKNEKATDSSSKTSEEGEDRYKELLGRREYFRIHFFMAVLSYVFFGLIPPLVYAYSFYQTGIRDYTVILVFLVSLVCITLLGIGKVYVGKQPKSYIKTMVYYTGIVISSSGISFVVGDMAGKFIEKLGWFKPNQDGVTSVLEGFKPTESGFLSSSGIRHIVD